MLNPFPTQFLALFAYAFLRVVLGSVLVYLGITHWQHRRTLGEVFTLSWWPYGKLSAYVFAAGEILLGICILLGAYTQYAMIAVVLMSLKLFILHSYFKHPALPSRLAYVLIIGIALTLFITGAGVPAVDLPL